MDRPSISVCVATFNGERFIHKQISSILGQLNETDEIVISDNGSTDNTMNIVNAFNDKRIKVFMNRSSGNLSGNSFENKFINATSNFENALKNAGGEIIFLSDQDDIWGNDKISVSLDYLVSFDLIVSDYYLINENDEIIGSSTSKRIRIGNFFCNLLHNPYFGCGMAFKRKILVCALPFPKHLFAHDLWIGFISQFCGRVSTIDEKLIYHRRHGQNVSYSFEKSKNSMFFKLKYRILFVIVILKRYVWLTFTKNE